MGFARPSSIPPTGAPRASRVGRWRVGSLPIASHPSVQLERLEQPAVGMKGEVPRAVARRDSRRRRIVRNQFSRDGIESPDQDPVEPEIRGQHEAARRIGLDHVRVRAVVAAPGKTARGRAAGAVRAESTVMALYIAGRAELAVRPDSETLPKFRRGNSPRTPTCQTGADSSCTGRRLPTPPCSSA